jgi:uncharacterized protein (TIGR03067 family)
MKQIIVIGVILMAFSSLALAEDKELDGTWIAVSATQNGEKASDDLVKSAKLVFGDGKYTASLGEIVESGVYKIDRTKKPNTIEMIAGGKPKKKKGNTPPAIIEVNGDSLAFCANLETMQTPKDFTSTAENKNFVVIYKRMK